MNRDDIVRWAREANVIKGYESELFVRFAALVAAAERDANLQQIEIIVEAAVAAEREACAKVCVDLVLAFAGRADLTALQCAEAIRARGDK